MTLLGRDLDFEWRLSDDRPLGRWGGGWRWVVGIKVARRTIIIEALVFSIRIARKVRPGEQRVRIPT